jgi:hypothetical protein
MIQICKKCTDADRERLTSLYCEAPVCLHRGFTEHGFAARYRINGSKRIRLWRARYISAGHGIELADRTIAIPFEPICRGDFANGYVEASAVVEGSVVVQFIHLLLAVWRRNSTHCGAIRQHCVACYLGINFHMLQMLT